MSKKNLLQIILFSTLVVTNIGCDQISKHQVRSSIARGEIIEVFGNHLILTHAENRGAFLGLGSELPTVFRILLLQILPAIAILFMCVIAIRRLNSGIMFLLGMAFALGGGIGNIYDRIASGAVTDFFIIDLGIVKTGIFNMADVSVMIGLFTLLFHILFIKPIHIAA